MKKIDIKLIDEMEPIPKDYSVAYYDFKFKGDNPIICIPSEELVKIIHHYIINKESEGPLKLMTQSIEAKVERYKREYEKDIINFTKRKGI